MFHAGPACLERAGPHSFAHSRSYLCCSAKPQRAGSVLGGPRSKQERPTTLTTQSPVPAIPRRPAAPRPNRLMRLAHAILEARTRMYLAAVTDPATGRIDPDLEQQVLRLMTL